jgi:2-oxoglutarate dehydrogenase E2 component (dihydrolipoamide succinyltransferase)
MSVDVIVPNLPESVADATLVTWHKHPGDAVTRDENLVDLETDKVVLEVPAPTDGVLSEIVRNDGETVLAGDLLAKIEAAGAAAAAPAASAPAAETASAAPPAASATEVAMSPAVRRLVQEHNLDPSAIKATGPRGRLTKADVVNFMDSQPTAAPAPEPAAAVPAPTPPPAAAPPAGTAAPDQQGRLEQRVPMTRLRRRIAERLVEAQQTAAILTTFNEINMQPVMDLRSRYKDKFEKVHGIRLGFMSFFVKAAVEALRRFPAVNASIDGADIIYHGYYDIGIAVSTERGLMVPIVRNCDQLSLADIEKAISEYAAKGREGTIGIEDLTGGTFSLTNGGVFGSLISTPILNPPQSAILGMHKTMQRAMVEDGQIVARPMMYLALSYDHRIVDGKEAVSFLVTIKELLEDPARLLLEV